MYLRLKVATLLVAVTAPPALAETPWIRLDEISIEGTELPSGTAAVSPTDFLWHGGGGSPSGVTGYSARVSPSATKTDTPWIETPQSVTVVTHEQLNDRNVQDIDQAIAYAPGIAANVSGFDPRADAFFIRGFAATYNGMFRDGLRQPALGLTVPRVEPYGLEALTVLRGPSAGLYGLGSPGGIIDATTKRPVFQPFGEIWLQAGTFDRVQGNIDVGGPVEGSDGTMAYRMTGVVRRAGTVLPGAPDDRISLAPAFTWSPSADTTLTLLAEFQTSHLPGTAFFANGPGSRVTRLYQGDAGFNAYTQQQGRIGYAVAHRLAPGWIVRQNFRYQDVENEGRLTQIDAIVGPTAQRSGLRLRETLQAIALDTQLEGRFATGPVGHTVLAGIDYGHIDGTRRLGFAAVPTLDLTGITDFTRFRANTTIPLPAFTVGVAQAQDQVGVYLQDQARWDRFVLTLTGRRDWVSQRVTSLAGLSPLATAAQDDSAFSYRVGLTYLLTPDVVPYASYATTFSPQLGTDATGRPFRPAIGDQIEAGVKVAIPNTGISASFAGFDIVQSSILQQDPANIVNRVATGAVESKGFEAEMTASLAPGTNVTVAFTHLDTRFLRRTSLATGRPVDGNAVSGIPGDTIAAFGTYLFPMHSWLAGLQIGGGVRFVGASFADAENTVRTPPVTLFDALLAYDFAALDPQFRGFRAQINAYNLFDRRYVSCEAGFCYRGAPATVIGSLIYRW